MVILVFLTITLVYRLLAALVSSRPRNGNPPPSGPGSPPTPSFSAPMSNYWPIWGELFIASGTEIIIASLVLLAFSIFMYYYYRREGNLPFPLLVTVGIALIILTNMFHGIQQMAGSIGGPLEIYWDAISISNPLDFIANYNQIQPTLSTHAKTQPPGAVLVIYLFTLLSPDPASVAIALATVSGLFSALFVNRIMQNFFDSDTARYGVFLYLLLPAVQVYYLANIYAIVATCMFGMLSHYLREDKAVRVIGSVTFIFVGTFISFLFVVGPAGLLVYEIFEWYRRTRGLEMVDRIRDLATRVSSLVFMCIIAGIGYLLLYLTLRFNYIEAFLHATTSENPNGFMLLANPVEYVVTRLQNVLDIAVFFGPFLLVLFFIGLGPIDDNSPLSDSHHKALSLVRGFLISLLLLFLSGAPKKGETARICMFILPLLLLPVLLLIQRGGCSWKEKCVLLLLVFTQAVMMQVTGTYVW
ncbi:MAG: hypothetical protein ACTSUH_10160 [Candidatus Thorarchaeota archaeon]